MSLRNVLLLVFALVAAAGTALVARGWMNSERAALAAHQKPAATEPTQYVLVAKTNLPVGRFVKAEDFTWQGWPEGSLAASYLVKDKRAPDELVGAVLRASLLAGEPVTDARLVKPGERGFMAAVLQPGMRALSLSVDATTGIAGFVFPGDRVDLLVTHSIAIDDGSKRKSGLATETVVKDLRVLATDQKIDDYDNKPQLAKTVTFEATPKQAEIIRVVSRIGSLSLTLRSLADDEAQGEMPTPEADALVASIEEGDTSDEAAAQAAMLPPAMARPPQPSAPKSPPEGRFTVDSEVSRLLGGLEGGRAQMVVVMRGAKSEEKTFRNGRPETPVAEVAHDAEMESAAANMPEELVP
ncbi:MAG TPA: Flp pilus assembly protein CpaB [Alphaproteobacteria bacterium]|jgi:pilus assembly protein CpaB